LLKDLASYLFSVTEILISKTFSQVNFFPFNWQVFENFGRSNELDTDGSVPPDFDWDVFCSLLFCHGTVCIHEFHTQI
jgi:hypothetical protein